MKRAAAPARASLRPITAPGRLFLFVLIFIPSSAAGVDLAGWGRGLLIAFDLSALCFLLSAIPLLHPSGAKNIKTHAAESEGSRAILLVLTFVATWAILATVSMEMAEMQGPAPRVVILIVASLILAWLFANSVYALSYAHLYYRDADLPGRRAPIDFPATPEPTYWDFRYFAFTLGMTFQTSDCAVPSTAVRRTVLLHSLCAFFFNIGALAFTINSLGSLHG